MSQSLRTNLFNYLLWINPILFHIEFQWIVWWCSIDANKARSLRFFDNKMCPFHIFYYIQSVDSLRFYSSQFNLCRFFLNSLRFLIINVSNSVISDTFIYIQSVTSMICSICIDNLSIIIFFVTSNGATDINVISI